VENAVKHGASLKTEPSKVTVRAELEAEGIRISVHDTGVGFAKSQSRSHSGTGLGLENVRRRLTLSYGAIASLNVQSSDASTSISFLIPNPAERATSSPQPASILA
jgi:LytS/YehU family sensor histidine kinase